MSAQSDYERQVAECTSAEDLKELTKRFLEATGVISRSDERGRDGNGVQLLPHAPTPNPSGGTRSSGGVWSKEIRWAESTGRRPVVIRADTEAELQALENQILYGS